MGGNSLTGGSGTWSVVSGFAFTITTHTSATSGVTGLSSGTYIYQWTITNGSCNTFVYDTLVVKKLLVTTISYNPNQYCSIGTAIVNLSEATGGTFSSSSGLNIDPVSGTINLANSIPNSYTITYSFSNGTCSGSTSTNITIFALTSLVIQNPLPVTSPQTVDITSSTVTDSSSSGLTFKYFIDDGLTTPLNNPNAIANSGTYYIEAINANGCT